ncbi:MAG: OmpA family protein [Polyangiaceae bacterium]
MRKFVAQVLCATILAGASASLAGCVVRAGGEVKAGGNEPAKEPVKEAPPAAPKPEEKKPAMNFEVENGQLKLPGPVVFESGKAILRPESDAVLDVVRQYLEAKPAITLLRIEGHTDNVGIAADNQRLSELRSMAVAQWLIAKGTSCKRLLPVGFGQDKPVADNKTPEGREQNRRTAFVNAELKGKAIGGMPVDGGGKVAGDPCK